MNRYTNPSGYVKYKNEDELKQELETKYFPYFFDQPWKPTLYKTKEVKIGYASRIDYIGEKNDKPCYVEVKNWWVTDKDISQILRYLYWINKKNPNFYRFYLICGGIEKQKENVLLNSRYEFDVYSKIILVKDILEIDPMEVTYWM